MRHPRARLGIGLRSTLLVGVLAAMDAAPAAAQAANRAADRAATIELFAGTAWNLPLPLVVRPRDGAPVRLRARYATRPWSDAPYYAYRFGREEGGRAIEVELVHHKLYLTNPAPPVERFEVTHGYNLALANAAEHAGRWMFRAGVGIVIAHPEGRIGGRSIEPGRTWLGGGYHLAGAALQLSVGRRYALGRGTLVPFAAPELKATAALARIVLDHAEVRVPNVALHLLGGFGVRRHW